MSVEGGNYFYKEEVGLNADPEKTYKSSGFGDLIIFPRYKILNYCTGKSTNEITVGLGFKIPVGSYNDSTGRIEPFSGDTYYITNPQSVQMSSGSQDLIFYALMHRGFTKQKIGLGLVFCDRSSCISQSVLNKYKFEMIFQRMADPAFATILYGKGIRQETIHINTFVHLASKSLRKAISHQVALKSTEENLLALHPRHQDKVCLISWVNLFKCRTRIR